MRPTPAPPTQPVTEPITEPPTQAPRDPSTQRARQADVPPPVVSSARHANRSHVAVTWLSLVALLSMLVAGCSASSSPDSADEAPAGASAGPEEGAAGSPAGSAETGGDLDAGDDGGEGEEGAGNEGSLTGTLPEGRMIARDATLSLTVTDLAAATSRVRAAAAAADGYVVQEDVQPAASDDEVGYATLVISVPTASLESTLTQLEAIGTVTARGLTSTDVTVDYIDTSARIATLDASIERVRGLMGQAENITDIVALEGDLSEREAELDALTAHAETLEGDVSRSSITVDLTHLVAGSTAASVEAEPPSGFTEGLAAGWRTFTSFLSLVFTALGAVLPFLALAILLWLPLAWMRRRRRRTLMTPPTGRPAGSTAPADDATTATPTSVGAER